MCCDFSMVTLESNCKIDQHVTIGVGNVVIYSNCTIGGKITIRDNVIIGANSLVNNDISNTIYGEFLQGIKDL